MMTQGEIAADRIAVIAAGTRVLMIDRHCQRIYAAKSFVPVLVDGRLGWMDRFYLKDDRRRVENTMKV